MRRPRKPSWDPKYLDATPSWTTPAQRSDLQEQSNAAKHAGDLAGSNALLAARLLALTVEDIRIQARNVKGVASEVLALERSELTQDVAERLRRRALELIEAIDRLPTATALMNEGQRRVSRKGETS